MSITEPIHAERLKGEIEVMRAKTRASLVRLPHGEIAWEEQLRSTVTGRRFRLRIAYPKDFPYAAPKAFVVEPNVSGAPHLIGDGSLCLFSDHVGGIGTGTSALLVRNRAVVWFLVWEVWQRTGEWMPQPKR